MLPQLLESDLCLGKDKSKVEGVWHSNTGLDIATVSVAFATKFSPFVTKTSSAVITL